jgi:hypothetical protein
MVFLLNSSFVSASFYPSPTKAVAFQIPATQLPESYTRMRVDCLHDRQSMRKSIVHAGCLAQKLLRNFAAVLGQLCHHFFAQPDINSG